MIRHFWTVIVSVAFVWQNAEAATTAPTWPSSVDELEDIMLLNTGYQSRGFADFVTPCSFSSQGSGHIASAEWIRTAFHDMATGNIFLGQGGLDASLIFELGGDNIGTAFATTLETFAPYLSSRSSMADIIAMGVYTAVRSCGGPAVPIRTGRIDATAAGPPGVPLPQNSLFTFQNQFARTGFNTTEMIAVTACGHTLGGVHAGNFPQIVPPGTVPNDYKLMDSTTVFDERIASEYVSGNSTDPLTVGPSKAAGMDSDAKVFAGDGNVTIKAMADPAMFASMCKTMLQKMIEVVPSGTVLTDPIVPYEIKPNALQLTLLKAGNQISFAGEIRVRTTVRPASKIVSVKLVYKDRSGGKGCGDCTINTQPKGTAAGFDDSFTFYSFSTSLHSKTSISTFNVLITLVGGATEMHDNNGAGFPVQDSIMLQTPQSCVLPAQTLSGKQNLTVVAAVRTTISSTTPVNLTLTLRVSRDGLVVPGLQTASMPMTKQSALGPYYHLYAATYGLDPTQSLNTKFDVAVGSAADSFKSTGGLPSVCAPLPSANSSSSNTSTAAYR